MTGNIDENILESCEAFIQDSADVRHNVSNAAEAFHINADRNTLRKWQQDAASTALLYERAMFNKLQTVLKQRQDGETDFSCFLYFELATYDGVDFMISNHTRTEFVVAEKGADNNVVAQLGQVSGKTREERSQAHILQFSGQDVCVLKDGAKYMIFAAHMQSKLTAFDRNFAQAMATVVQSYSRAAQENADHYKRKIRCCAVDRAGYNTSCEGNLCQLRAGRDWSRLVFYCLVHILYSLFKGVYRMTQFSTKISGMVNYALSFRPGGSLTTLRKAFFETLMDLVDIVDSLYISRQAQEYKDWIFRLFYGGDLEVQ